MLAILSYARSAVNLCPSGRSPSLVSLFPVLFGFCGAPGVTYPQEKAPLGAAGRGRVVNLLKQNEVS